jgi:hypothetical protein
MGGSNLVSKIERPSRRKPQREPPGAPAGSGGAGRRLVTLSATAMTVTVALNRSGRRRSLSPCRPGARRADRQDRSGIGNDTQARGLWTSPVVVIAQPSTTARVPIATCVRTSCEHLICDAILRAPLKIAPGKWPCRAEAQRWVGLRTRSRRTASASPRGAVIRGSRHGALAPRPLRQSGCEVTACSRSPGSRRPAVSSSSPIEQTTTS